MSFDHEVLTLKALADNNRLKIIEMLACACCELCACHLLEEFNITQPTLSHHMKTLIEAELIKVRKQGSWSYYSINQERVKQIIEFVDSLTTGNECCETKSEKELKK